ncbi:MAG: glutamate racemase [Firmicutes bacterium]|nr:glutamate racemase [Bacillota bacterium]
MDKNAPIGFFDSGIGGLTVLRTAQEILPCNQSYIYLSDREFAPYGDKSPEYITKRSDVCVMRLVSCGCKAVVVACNTATCVAIDYLRKKYTIPIIGVEPAIMPAVRECGQNKILVLVTPACANLEQVGYSKKNLRRLCDNLNAEGYNIIVSPQTGLATLIENNLGNCDILRSACKDILDRYPDICGVVLGCTHYIYLRPYFEELTNNKIKLFDGNIGVANRLKTVLSL